MRIKKRKYFITTFMKIQLLAKIGHIIKALYEGKTNDNYLLPLQMLVAKDSQRDRSMPAERVDRTRGHLCPDSNTEVRTGLFMTNQITPETQSNIPNNHIFILI